MDHGKGLPPLPRERVAGPVGPETSEGIQLQNLSIAAWLAAQQQPGGHYGQRKQRSQKGNQEAEESETQGGASNFPAGLVMRL